MRARGLKQACIDKLGMAEVVAPHAGAWIETPDPLV